MSGTLQSNEVVNEDEIRRWQEKALGYYYSGAIPSDYDNYDIDTLILMGEQSDLRALDMLAFKYLVIRDYGNARRAYKKSAVLGSTFALKRLGTMEYNSSSSPNEEPRVRSINELSYHQAGILRGDTQLLMDASSTIKFIAGELTEEEKKLVQKKGLLIYHQLEVARRDLGLSPFKNKIPEYLLGYFESNISYFEGSPLRELSYFSIPSIKD